MDKNKVRMWQQKIKEYVEKRDFETAKKYYEMQLVEMLDAFNSYNPKLEEYMNFLLMNFSKQVVSKALAKQIDKAINQKNIFEQERYALYMLAGNFEVKNNNKDIAWEWYKKAYDLCKTELMPMAKVEKKIDELNQQYINELNRLKDEERKEVKKQVNEAREIENYKTNEVYLEANVNVTMKMY